MTRPIKIGVLCPYSTIYPNLSYDFMNGIQAAISSKKSIQLKPEFVRQGEPSALKPVIEKLLNFDRVDMLTGVVGYRSLAECVPAIEQSKRIALFADMGEYIPFLDFISDNIFFNSFQYWQAEYALGMWAQNTFGGRSAVFMPVYDSGYHMHSAFRQGALMAGNTSMEYAVIRFNTNSDYKQVDAMMEYFQKFRKERPTFMHAIFCGGEAKDFLALFHQEGLHKELPLIVSPHMASMEILSDLCHLDMSFYTASLWNYKAESIHNQRFRQRYIEYTGDIPNAYALLGFEIGLILEELVPLLSAGDYGEAKKILRTERIKTPRGERNFFLDSEYATPVIDIEKVTLGNNQIHKVVVAEGQSLVYNHQVFDEIHRENVSGWLNPYLCV